ncbi:tetratricopeptide repeat protein [Robiginitalea sediminis]|uniref:tetratricopeptide repeat protein n=1 Tax=Robiginitalea sediminis TaxID=1982593 RepID=UPI000B4AB057|nr:tetratricopeptide repeat protein [Robiginitalea sediminis]
MARVFFSFFVLALWCSPLVLEAQVTIADSFKDVARDLVAQAPTDIRKIEEALEPYSGDTLLLSYFIRQCELKAYREGLAYAYLKYGARLRETSEAEQAEGYYNKALQQAKASENRLLQVLIHNQLGVLFLSSEEIKAALDNFQTAQNLAESFPEPDRVLQTQINIAINGIGNIYRLLEQYELAITHFEQSLHLDTELGNLEGQAINHQNLAECYEALGLLVDATNHYEKSLEVNEVVGSDRIEVVNKYGMAHVLAHEEREWEAMVLLTEALPKALKLNDPEVLSSVYIQMGWAQSRLKDFSGARANLIEGLRISEERGLQSNIHQGNTFLHDIYEAEGNYQQALEYYKKAQSARRMISNDLNRRYVFESISRSQEERRQSQVELISAENEIIKMELRRNRTTLLVGALLLTLFILILYILYRQYQLNSEKKVLTLEQSMLRSQMNPHFLFNSLNSIKLYIINNEQKNAVHYLNKFSKLVRKILEASAMREIPLSEELETVELYLNIENIRFNNEIDFSINVDPEINTELVRIPSLILQPFLENALWHGLSSKEGAKILRLNVGQAAPGYIEITITDNGIGRDAAHTLKERRVLKRKSLGLEITKERMANFSKDYQNTYQMTMEDLFDEEGNPAGTQVRLQIPTV